jgi:pimeloyl-ACP methyl ester carboxylesterase
LKSFENSAFVDVVIHSYRHRFGLSKSDPKYKSIQDKLSEMPSIIVPSITLDGQDDGVRPPSDEKVDSDKFTGFRRHKILSGVGHNVPQEAPEIFANAILELYSHNQNL